MIPDPHHVLRAAASAGLPLTAPPEALRLAENEVWRLPGLGVARVARAGQEAAAAREVRVARWLADHEIPAVRPLPVDQPVTTGDGRPVTFWEELPEHQQGSLAEVAKLVRRLHQLPAPPAELGLRPLDPFVRGERLHLRDDHPFRAEEQVVDEPVRGRSVGVVQVVELVDDALGRPGPDLDVGVRRDGGAAEPAVVRAAARADDVRLRPAVVGAVEDQLAEGAIHAGRLLHSQPSRRSDSGKE